jgi:hypothetical protein
VAETGAEVDSPARELLPLYVGQVSGSVDSPVAVPCPYEGDGVFAGALAPGPDEHPASSATAHSAAAACDLRLRRLLSDMRPSLASRTAGGGARGDYGRQNDLRRRAAAGPSGSV